MGMGLSMEPIPLLSSPIKGEEAVFPDAPSQRYVVLWISACNRLYPDSSGGADTVLVVPVIDLMGGQVVHARRGDRSNYRPLESALARSSDPLEVVRALLAAAPFPLPRPVPLRIVTEVSRDVYTRAVAACRPAAHLHNAPRDDVECPPGGSRSRSEARSKRGFSLLR